MEKPKMNLTTKIFLVLLPAILLYQHSFLISFPLVHLGYRPQSLLFLLSVFTSLLFPINSIPVVALILASVVLRKRLPWWIFLLEALLVVTIGLQLLIIGSLGPPPAT